MRALAVLALTLGFFTLFVLAAPTAQARTLYCTDLKGSTTCPGVVCVDSNLDNKFESNECVIIYCLDSCCYGADMCPPPPA